MLATRESARGAFSSKMKNKVLRARLCAQLGISDAFRPRNYILAASMKKERIIDIKQQLIGLFDQEDMIAFFDFQVVIDGGESVTGLCTLSQPKEGKSKSKYLSLLFIVDAVDEEKEELIALFVNSITWNELKSKVKGIEMVVPLPSVSYGTKHYIKGVEIYLNPFMQIVGPYIAEHLYPGILQVIKCNSNELVVNID